VLGSEPLSGFTHREQALLMLLVRYHHKGVPRPEPFQSLLAPGDGQLLAHLTACLRLAEYLERSRAGRVRDLAAEIGDRKVTLTLEAGEEPAVELWETRKHASLFQRAFGKKLVLKTAIGD
jgi:exopolyphosphatase/guanosine-5'-triphosphate,3'-diphosphate pyrophosphatase